MRGGAPRRKFHCKWTQKHIMVDDFTAVHHCPSKKPINRQYSCTAGSNSCVQNTHYSHRSRQVLSMSLRRTKVASPAPSGSASSTAARRVLEATGPWNAGGKTFCSSERGSDPTLHTPRSSLELTIISAGGASGSRSSAVGRHSSNSKPCVIRKRGL